MNDTIKELWYGNIGACDNCGVHDSEAKHLLYLVERNKENLEKISTPQQLELLEKYADCYEEYLFKMMEHAFCSGFCLASRFWAESLTAEI